MLLASEEVNPLIPHLAEIVVGLIAFSLLYFFLSRKVFPRFEQAFADRTEEISGGLARAEQAQAEARAALAEYREQLAQARQEASRIREEARTEGVVIVEEMRTQAQADASRIMASAQAQISADRALAITSLRADIGSLATQLAGRIVGESLEKQALQTRVVDRFLAELESAEKTGSGR
jgi:F-type H+-transporting ATPase subunit b